MLLLRPIRQSDNAELASIIRSALTEFKADKPGTVFYDASTDNLFDLFSTKGSAYFVAVDNETILGGAGIYPTAGLDETTCELVKIYLTPQARGKGIGKQLMEKCLSAAKDAGYKKVYLETMSELVSALPLYEKSGFSYLNNALGNSCHSACQLWMLKELD